MIKAIAIDDELPALKVIESFSSRLDFLQLEKTFVKPGQAIKYLKDHPVDLLFLDIDMPSLSGIDFYRDLHSSDEHPPTGQDSQSGATGTGLLVIFTTAHSEYAVEGFNLNAVDYLLKPFTETRFQQAVAKAKEIVSRRQPPTEEEFLFLRIDYSLVKIAIADILLVEGMDDYLRIHLKDKQPLLVRMTMKAILSQLPAARFIRVHRSYIVPLAGIVNIRNKIIYLEGKEIPIGVSYEKEFFARFPIHR
ncbi:MAG TPA: LytTR family DNA-binding domain-containing protein [Puia sp.]|nr:LytTR family DNA-binding domain-containing protein [Puia sp.]